MSGNMSEEKQRIIKFRNKIHGAIRDVAQLKNEMEMVKSFMIETAERIEQIEDFGEPLLHDISKQKEKLKLAKRSLRDMAHPLGNVTISRVTAIEEALDDYEQLLENSQ